MNTLLESLDAIFQEVADWRTLTEGSIVVRKNNEKFQQGAVHGLTEAGDGLIVTDVIDLNNGEFVTDAGIIRPMNGDSIYQLNSRFNGDGSSSKARDVVRAWALFTKHPALQKDLLLFVESSFSPDQILYWKKIDQLQNLFVPVQQKFKIGKFTPKVDHEKELHDRFASMLEELYDGKHLTYVAFIPREANKMGRFYSIGTKPHLETLANLKNEPGGFAPSQGGHLRIISKDDELPKKFLVDAGSYDLGSGMHTSLAIAEMVTDRMKMAYPQYEFVPVAGRGAQGVHQSY